MEQKEQELPLKNMLLAYPSDWMVAPEALAAIRSAAETIADFYVMDGIEDPKPSDISKIISEPLREVFTAPILSTEFCSVLLDEIKEKAFIPNNEEDEARQIPEFVLHEHSPILHNTLNHLVATVINPITFTLWQRVVTSAHIQIANYNPAEKKKGAWHHDDSSDITIVIPLNTDGYVGGGTEFFGRGILPPLPNGHGVIFPGLTHLHRGLAVEDGDRYLLVFWMKCKEFCDDE